MRARGWWSSSATRTCGRGWARRRGLRVRDRFLSLRELQDYLQLFVEPAGGRRDRRRPARSWSRPTAGRSRTTSRPTARLDAAARRRRPRDGARRRARSSSDAVWLAAAMTPGDREVGRPRRRRRLDAIRGRGRGPVRRATTTTSRTGCCGSCTTTCGTSCAPRPSTRSTLRGVGRLRRGEPGVRRGARPSRATRPGVPGAGLPPRAGAAAAARAAARTR